MTLPFPIFVKNLLRHRSKIWPKLYVFRPVFAYFWVINSAAALLFDYIERELNGGKFGSFVKKSYFSEIFGAVFLLQD